MRLLQLLVLACSLAELTWPENPKRTQLFRPSLAGRRRWCTAALLSSQSTAECADPSGDTLQMGCECGMLEQQHQQILMKSRVGVIEELV